MGEGVQDVAGVRGWATHAVAGGLFWFYKRVMSPALHAVGFTQCKYLPTCSEYGYVAVTRFGMWRGGWMALRRIARCHPWAEGGLDPVPDK